MSFEKSPAARAAPGPSVEARDSPHAGNDQLAPRSGIRCKTWICCTCPRWGQDGPEAAIDRVPVP